MIAVVCSYMYLSFFSRSLLIITLDLILGSVKVLFATWQWNADMKDQERERGTGGGMRLKPCLALPSSFSNHVLRKICNTGES